MILFKMKPNHHQVAAYGFLMKESLKVFAHSLNFFTH